MIKQKTLPEKDNVSRETKLPNADKGELIQPELPGMPTPPTKPEPVKVNVRIAVYDTKAYCHQDLSIKEEVFNPEAYELCNKVQKLLEKMKKKGYIINIYNGQN